jgi:hypothetical protein
MEILCKKKYDRPFLRNKKNRQREMPKAKKPEAAGAKSPVRPSLSAKEAYEKGQPEYRAPDGSIFVAVPVQTIRWVRSPTSKTTATLVRNEGKKPRKPKATATTAATTAAAIAELPSNTPAFAVDAIQHAVQAQEQVNRTIVKVARVFSADSGKCKRLTGTRHKDRKAPPYNPAHCTNNIKEGNDGHIYISVQDKKDAKKWRWVDVRFAAGRKALAHLAENDENIQKMVKASEELQKAIAGTLEQLPTAGPVETQRATQQLNKARQEVEKANRSVSPARLASTPEVAATAVAVASNLVPSKLKIVKPRKHPIQRMTPKTVARAVKELLERVPGASQEDVFRILGEEKRWGNRLRETAEANESLVKTYTRLTKSKAKKARQAAKQQKKNAAPAAAPAAAPIIAAPASESVTVILAEAQENAKATMQEAVDFVAANVEENGVAAVAPPKKKRNKKDKAPAPRCQRLKGKKYETRKIPPYDPEKCSDTVKKGNDNHFYVSVFNKKTKEWRWVDVQFQAGREALAHLTDNDDLKAALAEYEELKNILEQARAASTPRERRAVAERAAESAEMLDILAANAVQNIVAPAPPAEAPKQKKRLAPVQVQEGERLQGSFQQNAEEKRIAAAVAAAAPPGMKKKKKVYVNPDRLELPTEEEIEKKLVELQLPKTIDKKDGKLLEKTGVALVKAFPALSLSEVVDIMAKRYGNWIVEYPSLEEWFQYEAEKKAVEEGKKSHVDPNSGPLRWAANSEVLEGLFAAISAATDDGVEEDESEEDGSDGDEGLDELDPEGIDDDDLDDDETADEIPPPDFPTDRELQKKINAIQEESEKQEFAEEVQYWTARFEKVEQQAIDKEFPYKPRSLEERKELSEQFSEMEARLAKAKDMVAFLRNTALVRLSKFRHHGGSNSTAKNKKYQGLVYQEVVPGEYESNDTAKKFVTLLETEGAKWSRSMYILKLGYEVFYAELYRDLLNFDVYREKFRKMVKDKV